MMLKCLNYPVFLVNSGKLFHKEGPTKETALCSMFVLERGMLNFYCTISSKFKKIQIMRTSVIDKFECNSVYTLINSFAGR